MSRKNKRFMQNGENLNAVIEEIRKHRKGNIGKVDATSEEWTDIFNSLNTRFKRNDSPRIWEGRINSALYYHNHPHQAQAGREIRKWMRDNNVDYDEFAAKVGYSGSVPYLGKVIQAIMELPSDEIVDNIEKLTKVSLREPSVKVDKTVEKKVETATPTKQMALIPSRGVPCPSCVTMKGKIDAGYKVLHDELERVRKKRRTVKGKENDRHADIHVVAIALSCISGKPMSEFLL